jgi:protein SCO1/2
VYPFKGKVISVERQDKLVVIAHEAIPGFMDAMTMGFKLKDERDFDRLQRGDRVQASLVVQGMESWLESLFITRPTNPDATDDEVLPKPLPMPKPGDAVPDATLVNHDGKSFRTSALRGQTVVLTFIFTRCPLPEFCPLMNMNFAKIARELTKTPAAASKTRLLTISFDPEFDTPPVLKKTRSAFDDPNAKFAVTWDFASGKKDEVRKLADFFGLSYAVKGKNAEDTVHTLRTAVISPDGKVARVFTGNAWTVEEMLAEVRKY